MQTAILRYGLASMVMVLMMGAMTSTVYAGGPNKPHAWGHVQYRHAPPPPPPHHRPQGHRGPPPHAQAWGHPSRYQQRVSYRPGGYLPRQYFSSAYYVNDWRRHPGLYAPPRNHRWVRVDDRYVLAAVATGVIASIILAH